MSVNFLFLFLTAYFACALLPVPIFKHSFNFTSELSNQITLCFSFMFVIQYMMPLCITVSFIYSVAILVQNIVHEKEQRLKEVMKVMGLSNTVHWTAWFITSTCLMTIIVLLMTLILKVR